MLNQVKVNDIKLSDWKAIDEIEDAIDFFHSGEESDTDTILKIKGILGKFGFLNEKIK